ncbi:MAG TPA: hypothetical protein PKV69_03990 [Candidatus Hydrogenedentes bacterium]|nr:hypothetical protein [Candidatus Hydrogenedentota bacterium]
MNMSFDKAVYRHPARAQLVAHAESLVDGGVPVSAAVAAHVAECPRCAAELAAIRTSLEITASATAQDPNRDLAGAILREARSVRHARPADTRRRGPAALARALVLGVACASLTAALAVAVCTVALRGASAASARTGRVPALAAAPSVPVRAEDLRRKASDLARMAASLTRAAAAPKSPQERERLRALEGAGRDLDAALAALDRNPGCPRAMELVRNQLGRQEQRLRDVFIERTL